MEDVVCRPLLFGEQVARLVVEKTHLPPFIVRRTRHRPRSQDWLGRVRVVLAVGVELKDSVAVVHVHPEEVTLVIGRSLLLRTVFPEVPSIGLSRCFISTSGPILQERFR
jgi:hypothetical protein